MLRRTVRWYHFKGTMTMIRRFEEGLTKHCTGKKHVKFVENVSAVCTTTFDLWIQDENYAALDAMIAECPTLEDLVDRLMVASDDELASDDDNGSMQRKTAGNLHALL